MPPLPDREANPAGGRPRGFLWLAGAAWLALATAIGARLAGLAADDFYITYRYAQSVAAGRRAKEPEQQRVRRLGDAEDPLARIEHQAATGGEALGVAIGDVEVVRREAGEARTRCCSGSFA